MQSTSAFPPARVDTRLALLDAVARVKPALSAGAQEAEACATLPAKVVTALTEAGLFRLKLPRVLGGAEADPVTQIEVIEALAQIDASAAWCVMIGATSIARAGAFLSDVGLSEVFPDGVIPRAAGVGMVGGTAVSVPGGYRVEGRWRFASGIRHAQWLGAGVYVTEEEGSVTPRSMVFPAAEAHIHDNWQVAGLQGTGSCDFSVSDLFVPEHMTWKSTDAPRRGGPLYRLGRPGFVINEHAGFALGIGRRALEVSVALAGHQSRGPHTVPIASRAVFQHALGRCDLQLRAARAWTLEIYEAAWEMVCRDQALTPQMQAELRGTATYVTEMALEAATQAFRYAGGSALHISHPLQRCLRDLHAAAQHFMVSNSSYENHGQFLLGLPEADPMG